MSGRNMSENLEEVIRGLLSRKLEAEAARIYIQRCCGQIMSGQDVAAALGLGYHSLRKKFKHTTGQSIGQFLIRTKIEKAQTLLRETNFSVKEIAFQVGFGDPSHFSKVFKKRVGKTPVEFRAST